MTAEPYVAKLKRPDSRDHYALAACVLGEIVGVASFERLEGGTAEVAFELDPAVRVVTAIADRDRAADAASLGAVLAPRSIAVIGVSDRQTSIGHRVLSNISAAVSPGPCTW